MIEVIANNFNEVLNGEHLEGKLTYNGKRYEIWEISDEVHKVLCDMTDEYFEEKYPKSMWCSSESSNIDVPDIEATVNNLPLIAWENIHNEDIDEDDDEYLYIENVYPDLTTYFCDALGASQPYGICALAVDLAKHNNMKMSELFIQYEGDNKV